MQHDPFSPPRLVAERFEELGFEAVEETIVDAHLYDTPGEATHEFLLARAHGGSVGRAPDCEIGWTSLWSEDESLIDPGPWFSFHFDRWELPPGADEIARTSRASQAFTLRKNLALQFHPELTGDMLEGWLNSPGDGRNLLIADGQDPDILLAFTRAQETKARERAHSLVDNFLDRVAGLAYLVRH